MSETRPDLRLLVAFAAVARHASFTKAARSLAVGKGTVSRAVVQLEQELGTELVHRTTRAVSLSTAGLALYERITPHLSALDAAVAKLPERSPVPSGELRLTAPTDLGVVVLEPLLVQFARRYPDIRLDVRLTSSPVDLVAGGFDLAIRAAAKIEDSTLTIRKLSGHAHRFYAAPAYLARRGRPRQFGEAGHDWLLHANTRRYFNLPRDVRPRVVCDDFIFIRNMACDGAGVATIPTFLGSPFVREGLLDEVPIPSPPPLRNVPVYLVYPSSGEVPRKVTAFRDFLIESLDQSRLW